MRRFKLVSLLAISIFLSASYSFAAQLLVPSSSYPTIQAAIDAAAPDDEVIVSDGKYNENINFQGKAITVTSVNGAASTIIDGGGSGSVVTFENSEGVDSVLNGFTIQNGVTGIYCNGVSPTISNSIITSNTGTTVNTNLIGGINASASSLTIIDSTISNNTGWALYNYPGNGFLAMTGSLVDNNGGGVFFVGATLDVSKSVFTNNNNSGLRISLTGEAFLTNCLIAQNDSADRAGGIYVLNADLVKIINCTISDNTAQIYYGAGGVYLHKSTVPLVITNSILTGNTLQGVNNLYQIYPNTYRSNINISYTQLNQSVYSDYGPGNIYTSVWFVDSANGDYHLSPNSYSIDAGTSTGAPAEDLDGNSRPQNEVYDMGAYEFTCPADGDSDGYSASEGCGNYPIDCNDSDSSIHPGKAENCSDGIDNDCDGDIDSADSDCAVSCIDYVNSDDNPYGCSSGFVGVCYNGTRTCNGDGSWGDCVQDNQPTAEICDGLDNDCDGRRDEGLGFHACDTGLLGECAAGIESCKYYNNVYDWVCQPITAASSEMCDGKDNDCDGTVDNDVTSSCGTGLPGICALGTMTCDVGGTGTWGSCVPTTEPGTVVEVCDGQDNDCDGEEDEGFDSDGDGTADCFDGCPSDPNKTAAGMCGCGIADTDTDGDGTADCGEECPNDPNKLIPGLCGCGVADCPQLPLIDPDGNSSAKFGASVAISDDGTIAVVGAPGTISEPYGYYRNEYGGAGRVLIFQWDGSSWNLQQQLEHAQPYVNYYFGSSVSISGDGSTILVGANNESLTWANEVNRPGLAHVYVLSGGIWTLQANLVASDAADDDNFGISTALSNDGNTAVVGANAAEESGDPSGKGAAYVFVRNGTTWSQQARLKSTGTNNVSEAFGVSVGLSNDGNTLIVGANKGVRDEIDGIAYHGLAYVFIRSSEVWTQQGVLRASDYAYDEKFGISVSLSEDGNTALVGEPGRYALGSAYLFTRNETTWSESQKITPSDNFSDSFGISVSLSGDANKAIIGARTARTNGDVATGAAYVFTNNGSTWSELHKHFSEHGQSGDYYGSAVAISADGFTALAGASLDDAGGHLDQGAVYVIPTIIESTNIIPGAAEVAVDSVITVSFDQPMDESSINETTFTLTSEGAAAAAAAAGGQEGVLSAASAMEPLTLETAGLAVAGTVTYNAASNTATFTPTLPLEENGRYTVSLNGIKNAAGKAIAPYVWSFSTVTVLVPGDINNDKAVNLADAVLALQIMAGITPAGALSIEADINNDGIIGLEEALYALQTISAIRTQP